MFLLENRPVHPSGVDTDRTRGIRFREHAALEVMKSLAHDGEPYSAAEAAMVAVDWADALIAELKKKGT